MAYMAPIMYLLDSVGIELLHLLSSRQLKTHLVSFISRALWTVCGRTGNGSQIRHATPVLSTATLLHRSLSVCTSFTLSQLFQITSGRFSDCDRLITHSFISFTDYYFNLTDKDPWIKLHIYFTKESELICKSLLSLAKSWSFHGSKGINTALAFLLI